MPGEWLGEIAVSVVAMAARGRDITKMPAHRRVEMGISMVSAERRSFGTLTVRQNLVLAEAAGRHRHKRQWTEESIPALVARKMLARPGHERDSEV